MNRLFSFLLFLLVVLTVYAAMHYYVFKRILAGLTLAPLGMRVLGIIFCAGALSFIAAEILDRHWDITALMVPATVWMGFLAITLSLFVLRDVIRLMFPMPMFPSTLVVLISAACIGSYSLYNCLSTPVLREISITVNNLPPTLEGFRILQLSDLHLDGKKSPEALAQLVTRINAISPHLIVITGDLIDRKYHRLQQYIPILKQLQADKGVYSVTGNHEYYAGYQQYLRFIKAAGITDVSNQVITFHELPLLLSGVPDPTGNAFEHKSRSLQELMVSHATAPPKIHIHLSHQPLHFTEAKRMGVTLMLSGHTHAGQIPPLEGIVRLVFTHAYGLFESQGSYIYTTSGTGYWGPPMRFLNKCEFQLFTLASSK